MFQNNKIIISLILIGVILNFLAALVFTNIFDKNIVKEDRQQHMMIKSDIAAYNIGAQKILNNYKNEKFLFEEEYYRSFLPQILIAIYYGTIDEDIVLNKNEENLIESNAIFKMNNGKLGFFSFQILFYFFILFFLF